MGKLTSPLQGGEVVIIVMSLTIKIMKTLKIAFYLWLDLLNGQNVGFIVKYQGYHAVKRVITLEEIKQLFWAVLNNSTRGLNDTQIRYLVFIECVI